jgi:hypothetical protein
MQPLGDADIDPGRSASAVAFQVAGRDHQRPVGPAGEPHGVRWGHRWFSFAGPGQARLVPGEVTSVAVPLSGHGHLVP